MKNRLRIDDMVEVISGNSKGHRGRILQVDRANGKVVVEGANLRTHHEKVRQTKEGQSGGIEQREAAIHISNVMVLDPKTQKPARIGMKIDGDKKSRVTKGKNASGNALQ